jgi:Superfamily II DNA and RNA helicases
MPTSFIELGIHDSLVAALRQEGITRPTAIQEQTIPLILENRDIMGQSETGTGKTLAFLLPILEKVDIQKKENQAIILTPTHELAMQIQREIETLTKNSGLDISVTAIIGNVNIKRQIEKLKAKQQIIVGSSGRIFELIQKKKISSHTVKTIVIDEADRLLDEDNSKVVKAVIKSTYSKTQLLLFSATLPEVTRQKASDLLKNPEIIRVTDRIKIPTTITHTYFIADQRDKIEVLRKLIRLLLPSRALIFINKSEEIEKLIERLRFHGLEASGIYGEANKAERRQAIDSFKSGKINLLVASDLAARGLDIKEITHVFNLDLPEDPQLYLHRVGRSGRAGERGQAISIVTPKEVSYIKRLESSFGIDISRKEMFQGRIVVPRK